MGIVIDIVKSYDLIFARGAAMHSLSVASRSALQAAGTAFPPIQPHFLRQKASLKTSLSKMLAFFGLSCYLITTAG
jgi:hypothetical protein